MYNHIRFVNAHDHPRDLLDGLKNRGFKLNRGLGGAGVFLNAYHRRGGHYIGGYTKFLARVLGADFLL